jgi:hypothetical protein
MAKSFKVEVKADASRRWSSNMLRFAGQDEAEAYGRDLFSRWSAVREWRVTETQEAVSHRWDADRRQSVPAPPVLRVIEGGRGGEPRVAP